MPPETVEERTLRKAKELRKAMLGHGVVISPDMDMEFADLPEYRRARWIKLATAYIEIFG